jgi:hypothetical protein
MPQMPDTRPAPPDSALAQWRWLRLFPLAVGMLAMAAGVWTGLIRLGLALPDGGLPLAQHHAALMIAGFLGTVISLERAVALGSWWAYGAPALSSLGTAVLLAGTQRLAAWLFVAAAAVLLLASIAVAKRHVALFTVGLAVAAACWGIGSALWLAGYPVPVATGWWLDFLVLTITAERLELSRVAAPSRLSQVTLAAAALLLLAGSARGELANHSAPSTAVGLIGCAVWLLRHDVARRTVLLSGQPRFSATAILLGHGWLAAAGVLLLAAGPGTAAFSYDAAVHAIAIGFVLSMIFAHAPIILPAVIRIRVRYSALVYLPLALLHGSALLRIGSDLLEWTELRAISGVVTVLALASFAAILVGSSWPQTRRNAPRIDDRSSSAI